MAVICFSLSFIHLQILKFLSCFLKTGDSCVFFDMTIFEIVYPFLERCLCYFVELIDSDDEIFWENLIGCLNLYESFVSCVDLQSIFCVYPDQ